jgi:quinol monooxygenase YgiN
MVIVAGQLIVGPGMRDGYLAGCAEVVEQARVAAGCLDFTISADLLDPARINVLERWASQKAVEAFRGDGPAGALTDMIVSAAVAEYDVSGERRLT